MAYRTICKKYGVTDIVKVVDKSKILDFFTPADLGKTVEDSEGKVTKASDEGAQEEGDDGMVISGDEAEVEAVVEGKTSGDKRPLSSSKKHKERSSKKDRHKKRDEPPSPKKKKEKKDKKPISHEQLLENLNIVVDKRDKKGTHTSSTPGSEQHGTKKGVPEEGSTPSQTGEAFPTEPSLISSQEEEEQREILACLSSTGFEASNIPKEVLEKDRMAVEKIVSSEIPVGNSASILRCGAPISKTGSKSSRKNAYGARDFGRVLDLYYDSIKEAKSRPKKKAKHTSSNQDSAELMKAKGKPIIVVPNAMTCPITLLNAKDFFEKSTFVPREVALRSMKGGRPSSVTIKRNVSSRLGGAELEYEIIDNPRSKLGRDDWDRVVAVLALGAGWQFKGWKKESPVDIFSEAFGFFVSYEGAPIPKELQGWNVKRGMLSKDKRGLDSVVYASFWNGLDEWMSVHKREYLPDTMNP